MNVRPSQITTMALAPSATAWVTPSNRPCRTCQLRALTGGLSTMTRATSTFGLEADGFGQISHADSQAVAPRRIRTARIRLGTVIRYGVTVVGERSLRDGRPTAAVRQVQTGPGRSPRETPHEVIHGPETRSLVDMHICKYVLRSRSGKWHLMSEAGCQRHPAEAWRRRQHPYSTVVLLRTGTHVRTASYR